MGLKRSLTYQTLQALPFCRVPINSILGFIIRTYEKVGFGRLRFIDARLLEATAESPPDHHFQRRLYNLLSPKPQVLNPELHKPKTLNSTNHVFIQSRKPQALTSKALHSEPMPKSTKTREPKALITCQSQSLKGPNPSCIASQTP